jgi:dienelactone hydrolase
MSIDPMSMAAATRRATLADVCRRRPRRPLSLLNPRFLRRGVIPPRSRRPPNAPPNASPHQPPPGVVFDEVAFDVACEREGGDPPQHLRTVPMWVVRPATAGVARQPQPPSLPPLLPAVLWIHGKTESRDTYLPVAESLARLGLIVALPDMPHHGGRRRAAAPAAAAAAAAAGAVAGADAATDEFEAAVAAAVRSGDAGPLVLDWAWDALCALDALQALYGRDDDEGEDKRGEAEGGGGGGSNGGDEHSRPLTRANVRAYRWGSSSSSRAAESFPPTDAAVALLDPARVALAGASMGGSAALLASLCLSERRVAACAPFIALQYWRWGLDNGDSWLGRAESLGPAFEAAIEEAGAGAGAGAGAIGRGDEGRAAWERAVGRLLPGLLAEYDAPRAFLALRVAGVPLLALNSSSDLRCPIDGVRAAWREADEATAAAAAGGRGAARHELFVDPSARGHELTPAMMERFEAWLGELDGFF